MEWGKTLKVYRTEDGGQTLSRVHAIDLPHDESVVSLTMTSPNDAFLVGEGEMGKGFVIQLSEKGQTLRIRHDLPADLSEESNALDVFGDGTGHLWIVGKELILHSADNGRTWENQYQNSIPPIDMGMSGTALPGGHAWMAVANFSIYQTDDYGRHWRRSLSTLDSDWMNFESISFQDQLHGCAIGRSASIYCTTDGGETWSSWRAFPNYQTNGPFSSKLLMSRSGHGWASVGGALYKTEDGGQRFREVLTHSTPPASQIAGETQALRTPINGPTKLAWDDRGFLFIVESVQGRLLRLDLKHASIRSMLPDLATSTNQEFDFPNAIVTDKHGNLFVGDFNGRLRQMNEISGEAITLLPTPSDPLHAPLEEAYTMAVGPRGDLFVVGRGHKLLRWTGPDAGVETVAGTGSIGFSGDGGPATAANLAFLQGVAVNAAGDIFIADYQNCRIRKIDAKTGIITTIAGNGECVSKGDGGLATQAALDYPSSVVVDRAGDAFFVEGGTDRVRRIDKYGIITTYAGTGEKGFSGDGGPASKAKLNNPAGLALDSEGNLYISEFVNNRIRRVDAVTQIITTIAGNGKPQRIDVQM